MYVNTDFTPVSYFNIKYTFGFQQEFHGNIGYMELQESVYVGDATLKGYTYP